MAASQKRELPSQGDAVKSRKRTKLGAGAGKTNGSTKKKEISLDSISGWQQVSMPDRMDDYEGFFGLEEIDGIDVIRDDSNKKITYLTSADRAIATNEEDGEADDWDGFEEGADADITSNITPESSVQLSQKPSKSEKKSKKKLRPDATTSVTASAFNDLETTADDADAIDISAWQNLALSPDTLASLRTLGFSKPTKIQESAIPVILSGSDVIAKAATGSGKTLAFGIPILETFLERRTRLSTPIALVLSPTRELAHQLSKHISALSAELNVVTLTGGLSVQKQRRQLKAANVIIGTPGRLWEVISGEAGLGRTLKNIQYLVLDEADRLLSEGHFKELEDILNALDREDDLVEDADNADFVEGNITTGEKTASQRQTLVFSATFDKGLQRKLSNKQNNLMSNKDSMEYLLSKLNFKGEPQFVDTNPVKQLATGLKEGLIECGAMEKDLYLYTILLHNRNARAMVFVNSINAVRRITPFLDNLGLPALALHSGMIQKARLRSVERFTQRTSILVTTDVAARGLDIPNVELVIHYHLPRAADMYVHRSGRTARAGKQGSSILICSPEEVAGVRRLIAKVHAQTAISANEDASAAAKQGYYIRTLDPDRKVVARLKPRATLAKKLADINIAKEKQHKEDDFFHEAAADLGIDYDSEEFAKQAPGKHGRGSGRKQKEKQAREVSKGEAGAMRAELREMLKTRVNIGVSEKYITSGRVDVDELLRQQEVGSKTGEFLGNGTGFAMEDVL